jgi:predicted PurR-regulated permease PerM
MRQQAYLRALFWCALLLLTGLFLVEVKAVLLPFVVGMLVAYFLDPAADRLQRSGLSRTTATALITVGFFSTAVLLLAILIPLLVQQGIELVGMLPQYINTLAERYGDTVESLLNRFQHEHQTEAVKSALGDMSGMLISMTGTLAAGVFHSGMAVANLVSLLLITPVVAFYLLRDWDKLVSHIEALLPRPHAETVRQQMLEIDLRIAGFVRGQFTVMLILAAFYGIALTLAGLRFGLVIGIMSGLLVIIPYLGAFFGMVVSVGVALSQFDDMMRVGIVLGIYIFGQVMEGNFITPKLVGDRVGLHPVWLIFGLLAGGALFGFLGVLIAVPVTAIIGVLTRFALSRYLQSPLYRGDALPPPPKP